jgi:hypothetical protein
MDGIRSWSALVLILLLALVIVGSVSGVAQAQEDTADEGDGRPLVGYYILAVVCVGGVMWAVCRTSHR